VLGPAPPPALGSRGPTPRSVVPVREGGLELPQQLNAGLNEFRGFVGHRAAQVVGEVVGRAARAKSRGRRAPVKYSFLLTFLVGTTGIEPATPTVSSISKRRCEVRVVTFLDAFFTEALLERSTRYAKVGRKVGRVERGGEGPNGRRSGGVATSIDVEELFFAHPGLLQNGPRGSLLQGLSAMYRHCDRSSAWLDKHDVASRLAVDHPSEASERSQEPSGNDLGRPPHRVTWRFDSAT
jgi:hypothetical protein